MKTDKAKKVAESLKIANQMQENIDRLNSLNKYDHSDLSCRSFFIEFGGGSTHVRYFPKNNEIGDLITEFFVGLFGEIAKKASDEIDSLLK